MVLEPLSTNTPAVPTTTTTTSSRIRSLLLQAWRERWSEVEFGRNIKRLLPRGVSGDVYHLAEAILRQAVSGPVPNALMMTYLEHCLGAQVVSFGTVIQTITEVQPAESGAAASPACTLCLLQFLNKFIKRTSCYGNEDECLALCRALISLLSWLFRVISSSVDEVAVASATTNSTANSANSNSTSTSGGVPSATSASSSSSPDNISGISGISNGNSSTNQSVVAYYHQPILKLSGDILSALARSPFLKALLYVGKLEEPATWRRLITDHQVVQAKLAAGLLPLPPPSQGTTTTDSSSLQYVVQNFLKSIDWLKVASSEVPSTSSAPTIDVATRQLTSYSTYVPYRLLVVRSLQSAIAFNALLERFDGAEVLAGQILTISRYFDISLPAIYCESLHATFLSLIEGQKISLKVETPNVAVFHKWSSFFLMKLPQVFRCLAAQTSASSSTSNSSNSTSDAHFEAGLELLMRRAPLLELFTSVVCPEFLPKFFHEVEQLGLCSAATRERFMEHCKAPIRHLTSEQITQSKVLVVRAETTLKTIFCVGGDSSGLLGEHGSSNQQLDQANAGILPGVLCRMHNSLEILLCASACTGSLSQLAAKVLKLNEQHKRSDGENIRNSQTRAVYFDISFLILCSITVNFGTEVLLSEPSTADSFFARWVALNFTEELSSEAILAAIPELPSKPLMEQWLVANAAADFKTSLVRWPDVVWAVQLAVEEVLTAWEAGVIDQPTVDVFVERLKSRVLFASVVAFCMLVAKLKVAGESERTKIHYMLEQLYIPYNFEEAEAAAGGMDSAGKDASAGQDQSTTTSSSAAAGPDDSKNLFYKERGLVLRIVNRHLYNKYLPDFEPPRIDDKPPRFNYTGNALRLSRRPLNELLRETLAATGSHLTMENIYDFDKLVVLGGIRWFTSAVVECLFEMTTPPSSNITAGTAGGGTGGGTSAGVGVGSATGAGGAGQPPPDEIVRLQRAVDMAYGLFHLDLEQCALVLMRETIPRLLLFRPSGTGGSDRHHQQTSDQHHNHHHHRPYHHPQYHQQQQWLSEPRVSALLRLTLMTTFGAISHVQVLSKGGRPRRSDHRLEYGEFFNEWQLRNFSPEMIEGTPYAYELSANRGGGRGGGGGVRIGGGGRRRTKSASTTANGSSSFPEAMDIDGGPYSHGGGGGGGTLEELLDDEDNNVADNDDDGCGDLLREPLYAEFVRFLRLVLDLSLENEAANESSSLHPSAQAEDSPSSGPPCCWSMVSLSLLEQILLCLRSEAREFLQFVPFSSMDAVVRATYDVLTFEQLLAYLCLEGSGRARKAGARLLCQLQMSKGHGM